VIQRIQTGGPSVEGNEGRSSQRLADAAHEFEAQMLKELLKPLTTGMANEDDDPGLGSTNTLTEVATESLGRTLSATGGLGIAKAILASLSRNGIPT